MTKEDIEYLTIEEYIKFGINNKMFNMQNAKNYSFIKIFINKDEIVIGYNEDYIVKSVNGLITKIDISKLNEKNRNSIKNYFKKNDNQQDLNKVLKKIFGYDSFRGEQEDIIKSIISERDTLVLMPTGAGKSLCYQLPAIVQKGTAIVISPLISLMEDQVKSLNSLGVKSAYINSSLSKDDYINIIRNINDYQLIYISPERFNNHNFKNKLKDIDISFFAIDEAHCVSKWGHDFRPDYLNLKDIKEIFNKPIIALTATADLNTRRDIPEKLLMNNFNTFISSFDRPNIKLLVKEKDNYKKQLLEFIEDFRDESGIVYCLSRKKVEEIAKFLKEKGYSAYPYHGGMKLKDRATNQERFVNGEKQIIVGTIAFGLGINKPNVRYVVHCDLPNSIESYYQEIGRAGRDGEDAFALMLYGMQDFVTRSHMIFTGQSDRKMQNIAKLNEMLAFADTLSCKREYLMNYFGNKKVDCNNCTSCLDTEETKEVTSIAKLIIKTIKDTGEFHALGYICSLMKGSNAKTIKEKHKKLETYNSYTGPEQELKMIIRQLVVLGVLEIDLSNNYNSLKVKKELEEDVFIKPYKGQEKKEKIIVNTSLDADDKEIYEQLKELRLEIAQENNIAPYMVLHDKSLKQMAKHRPETMEELAKLHGWGEKRLEAYGAEFVRFFNN